MKSVFSGVMTLGSERLVLDSSISHCEFYTEGSSLPSMQLNVATENAVLHQRRDAGKNYLVIITEVDNSPRGEGL
jgi:hypothetical protein